MELSETETLKMRHRNYSRPQAKREDSPVVLEFWNQTHFAEGDEGDIPLNPPIGYVAAKNRPGGKSVLVAGTNRQADWPILEPIWNGLLKWLKAQGWLDSETPIQGEECFEWPFNGLPYDFANAAWEYSQLQMRTTNVIFPPFYGSEDIGSSVTVPSREMSQSSKNEYEEVTTPEVKDAVDKTAETMVTVEKEHKRYLFRKTGEFWEIAYEDSQVFRLKDIKGLGYIAYLLQRPNEPIAVLVLESAIGKTRADLVGKVSADEAKDLGGDWGGADERLDDDARQEYEDHIEELEELAENARDMGDEETAQRHEWEKSQIVKELAKATGLYGRNRQFNSPRNKARVKLQKQIKAAIDKIRPHNHKLAQYLDDTIKTGSECVYNPLPNSPIEWET